MAACTCGRSGDPAMDGAHERIIALLAASSGQRIRPVWIGWRPRRRLRLWDRSPKMVYEEPMALAPTLYDFDVALSHVDRSIDQRLNFKTARHPSEALDRVWLRVLAFCWQWEERIAFGPGLSDPDAPDLLAKDLTGDEVLWIRVGKADPVRLQKEADRHPRARVAVLFDSTQRMEAFATAARGVKLDRLGKVELAAVDPALLSGLAAIDERRNRLSLTIVGDHFYVERNGQTLDGPLARASL